MASLSMRSLALRPAARFAGLVAVIGLVLSPVGAQIGTDLCACTPAVYTFELIFDALCEDTNVGGLGIENSDCFVAPAGVDDDITDFVPVAVSAIDILELDQTLVPFAFQPYRGSFRSGDTFTYSSVVGTDPNLPPERIPGGFQMNLLGVNAIDQAIQNVWIITFTNECGVFPVFQVGEQIGWTKLVNISLPEELYCPLPDTGNPTQEPTFQPTEGPTTSAPTTSIPTSRPGNPTFVPTVSPTEFPTAFPTDTPTDSPSEFPTPSTAKPTSTTESPTVVTELPTTAAPVTAMPSTPDQTEAPVSPTCPPFPLKGKGKGGKGMSMDGKGGKGKDSKSGKGMSSKGGKGGDDGTKTGESKSKGGKGGKSDSDKSGKGKGSLIYEKKSKGGKGKDSDGKLSRSRGKKLQAEKRRSLLQDFFDLAGLAKGKVEGDFYDDAPKGKSKGKSKDATDIYKSKYSMGKGSKKQDYEDDDDQYLTPGKGGKGYGNGHSSSNSTSAKGKGYYDDDMIGKGKGKGSSDSVKGKGSGSTKGSKGSKSSKGYDPPIDPECLPPKKEPPKSGGKNMMMMDLDHGKAGKAGMKKSHAGKAMAMDKSKIGEMPKGSGKGSGGDHNGKMTSSKGGKGGKSYKKYPDGSTKAPSSGKGKSKGGLASQGKGNSTLAPVASKHTAQPTLQKTATPAPIVQTVAPTITPVQRTMENMMGMGRVRRNKLI